MGRSEGWYRTKSRCSAFAAITCLYPLLHIEAATLSCIMPYPAHAQYVKGMHLGTDMMSCQRNIL